MWFFLSIIAAFLYASLWLFACASKGMSSGVVTVLQFSLGPVVLLASMWHLHFPWHEPVWYAYLLISFFANPPLSWALNYASQRIEVSLIKPLSGLSSLSAALVPVLVFGETLSMSGVAGMIVGTAGLLLLYHAKWHVWKTPYPWIVLLTVLVFGVNAAVVGAALKVFPHPIVMSGIACTANCLFALFYTRGKWKEISWTPFMILLMAGFALATLGQDFATNIALQLAPAGYVISVKRTSIIIASVGGYLLFRERTIKLPRLLAATTLVVAGVILLLV